MRKLLAICYALSLAAVPAMAENWPMWRGPRGDGTSCERNIPTEWSETKNVAWKVPVEGIGHSSPIVWQDRVFITSCNTKTRERLLLCFRIADGKLLWRRTVLIAPLERKHRLNSYASSTPATDGKRVFVTFFEKPHVRVVAYDFSGKEVWRTSPGKFYSPHGFCSSPVLYKNLVIVNCDQDARFGKYPGQKSFIVALDAASGREVWRIDDRPYQIRSYCVPLIVKAAGRMQMVLSGTKCVTSYDPDTGKLLWQVDGPTEQFVASPVFGKGLIFLTAGFPTYHNIAIRPDGRGNVTRTHVVWHENNVGSRKAAYVPSPIAYRDWFFLVTDTGYAHCFEALTGKRLWMHELGRHHSASPVLIEGRLYFLDDDGTTWVLKASPKFEPIARNELDDEAYGSPAVSQGKLIVRTLHYLYCIESRRDARGE